MRLTTTLPHFLGFALCAAGIANAAYAIQDTFDASNFFSSFEFFSDADPTQGFVNFHDAATANASQTAGYSENGQVYLGADSKTMNPINPGRGSVRVSSIKSYNTGLFLADIEHMPSSTCGVWPAFWTLGSGSQDWPAYGEIDIIEGVSTSVDNTITLHTSPGCTMQSTNSAASSNLTSADCNAGTASTGCGMTTTAPFGSAFNNQRGGVYAMEWTTSFIRVFFFPRSAIPADIVSNSPDPSTWGTPVSTFSGSGCNIASHFQDHQIVFDTTFCGDWAGKPAVWEANPTCSQLAPTCNAYVAQNPTAFKDAYWLVNSVKVFQQGSVAAKRAIPFTS